MHGKAPDRQHHLVIASRHCALYGTASAIILYCSLMVDGKEDFWICPKDTISKGTIVFVQHEEEPYRQISGA